MLLADEVGDGRRRRAVTKILLNSFWRKKTTNEFELIAVLDLALKAAAKKDYRDIIDMLIAQDAKDLRSAVTAAAAARNRSLVLYLATKGAVIDPKTQLVLGLYPYTPYK